MQTQFKPNVPLCRHGMRDCPVKHCSFRNSKPTVLYSSALKGPMPTTPALDKRTAMDGPLARQDQFGTHDKFSGDARRFQNASATPSHPTVSDSAASLLSGTSGTSTKVGTGSADPVDGSGLVQAADQVAIFSGWLKSQMDVQKAKIKAMSEEYSIPVPDLESNPFFSPPLSLMTPSVGNVFATTTNKQMMPQENNKKHVFDEYRVPSAPPATRMPPALPVQGLWQPETQGLPHTARAIASGPLSARAPMPPRPSPFDQGPNPGTPTMDVSKHPQVTSIAPKKDDMAYKTTPCRHFTLNQGWCPWGDECGFIHDPELGWVSPLERTSGSSTPSSLTLGDNKSGLPGKTAIDVANNSHRSVSSKGAHCWGYIQGICPHSVTCRYLHPVDIVPYIKYTPCLTYPRCGYPVYDCPLKHPQVDKLTSTRQTQLPSTLSTTTNVTQARSGTVPRAETYSDVSLAPQHHSQPPFMTPALFTPAGGFVIPHDEAYATAKLHHRPTAPSAEMFSPAPVRPLVRLRRPSEDMSQNQATEMQRGLGLGTYQGRARSVSIAVQKLGAQFSGPVLQAQAKAFARGHGRGKSLNIIV